MFLATLPDWYTCSARPHRVASSGHSWRTPRSGTKKCTIPYRPLRTYCSIPYTGLGVHIFIEGLLEEQVFAFLPGIIPPKDMPDRGG